MSINEENVNPFEVGNYTYLLPHLLFSPEYDTELDIEIYKVTKYTISFRTERFSIMEDYKQRKVRYTSSGDAYVNVKELSRTLTFDKFKKV
jgi:hypothetical protein